MGYDVYNKAFEHRHHILEPFLLTTYEHGEHACQSFNVPLLPDCPVTKENVMRDLQQITEAIGGHQFKVK